MGAKSADHRNGTLFSGFVHAGRRGTLGPAALFLLAGLATSADAAPIWNFDASVEGSVGYTSNVLLEMVDPESDVFFSVDLGAGVTGQTPRSQLYLTYSLGYDLYTNEDDLNGFRHQGLTQNKFTLADDLLFLDVAGSVRERDSQVNLQRPATVRTINTRRTTQWTGSIHPYIHTDLGQFAELMLGAEYSIVDFSDPDVGSAGGPLDDDQIWSGHFSLTGIEDRSRLGWELYARASADDDDFESQEYGSVLRVATGQSFKLVGRVGYDHTDGRRNGLDIDEIYWRAGFEFSPSKETYFRAEGGERYGSPSYEAQFRHQITRRVNFDISYREQLQTDQQRLVEDLSGFIVTDGAIVESPTPIDNDVTGAATINKTVRATLSGAFNRTNLSLSGFHMKREFDQYLSPGVLAEDEISGVTLTVDRRLGRRTDLGFALSFENNDNVLPAQAIDGVEAQVFGVYKFGNDAALRAEYSYQKREDGLGVEVDENVFRLSISKRW